jgi:hypothetical protein
MWFHPRVDYGIPANDVVVLRVTQDFGIDPIILNPNIASEAAGQEQTITGWGDQDRVGADLSDMLRKATMLPADCDASFAARHQPVPAGVLCAAFPGRAVCYGDQGGPMFVTTRDKRFYQTGIASWSFFCDPALPYVFTNVRLVASWIKSVGGAGVGTPRGTPPHDNRRSPRALTGFPTNFAASTRLATVQAGEPGWSYGGNPDRTDGLRWMHHTIWYAWRAPSTGNFKVSTRGTQFDTVVNVFDLSRGTWLASNDDCPASGSGLSSCASFAGTSGRQYLFQFGGYSFGAMGDLKITLSRA